MIVTSRDQITDTSSWMGHKYAIDVETTGTDFVNDDLIGVALYVQGGSYYFVLHHYDGHEVQHYLTLEELHDILLPVVSQPDVLAVGHNIKFDLHFLKRFGLDIKGPIFDTLIAAQLLDENRRNGLKQLTPLVDDEIEHVSYSELAEYPEYHKDHPFATPLDKFGEYAEKDVIITSKLWKKFRIEMAKDSYRGKSIQDVFLKYWMPMVEVLQEIEEEGFRINLDLARELLDKYNKINEENVSIVQRAGYEMLSRMDIESIPKYYWKIASEHDVEQFEENDEGDVILHRLGVPTPVIMPTSKRMKPRILYFNIGSPKQMVDLIMAEVDLPQGSVPLNLTKKGEDSVNVENLYIIKHYMGDRTPHYIDALITWRKSEKFVGTYLNSFLTRTDSEGRIHCTFSMAMKDSGKGGTRTGRLSSSDLNLQNIPSRGEIGVEARKCFVAREGYSLIVADYEAMEMVIAAHFSRDPMLMKAFAEGLDIHSITASGAYNIPYDEFRSGYKSGDLYYDRLRRAAKVLNFGQAYGMGAAKLQKNLLIETSHEYSIKECQDMIKAFNATYRGLYEYKQKIMEFAGNHGFVPTVHGRKRRLPNALSEDREVRARAMRQAFNALIQGSCADILFEAMIQIQRAFRKLGGSIVASVHDELVAEVPDEHAEEACHIMQSLMVDLINPILRVPLKAEAAAGKDWYSAKKG